MRLRALSLGLVLLPLAACTVSFGTDPDDEQGGSSQGGSSVAGQAGGSGTSGQAGQSGQAGKAGQAGQGGTGGAGGAGGAGGTGAAGVSGSSGGGTGGASGGSGSSGKGGGGSSGVGGSSGGKGGGAGVDVGFVPSAEFVEVLAEIDKLTSGQAADMDGDGKAETHLKKGPSGSYTVTTDADGDGHPEVKTVSDGQGLVVTDIDPASSGSPSVHVEQTVTSAQSVVVRSEDGDGDGVFERRETWTTLASSPADQAYTLELDTDADGTFDQTESAALTKAKNAGDCNGADNFPAGGTDLPTVPGHVSVNTGTEVGSCGAGDAKRIAEAVDCALTKGKACLSSTNSEEYGNLMNAMAGSKMPLRIGCGNVCPNVIATTTSREQPWVSDSEMNINLSEWQKLDAEGRCNIMLHEMMHWAGDNGSADHNDSAGKGDDKVYSCGRYCGKCSDAGHGSPGNSSVDCARCADTKTRKEKCGVRKKYTTLPCAGALGAVCHAGIACIAGLCDTCGGFENETCDGSKKWGQATCCSACPGTCNKSNDVPCNGTPADQDSCTDANPPGCK